MSNILVNQEENETRIIINTDFYPKEIIFKIAEELDMYIILRPGPYICSEWDFGALPAWLVTKAGIEFRINNKVYYS
jgi:beta-galactosidase